MNPLFWLDSAVLSVSALLAAALTLAAVGSGPSRSLNLRFAAFSFLAMIWAAVSLLWRLALWLERGNPLLFAEISTLTLALMAPVLLVFTLRYLEVQKKWSEGIAILGVVILAVAGLPLFRHQLIFDPRLEANGSVNLEVHRWALVLAAIPATYFVWSLALFLRERRKAGSRSLLISVVILVIGFVSGGLLEIRVPILSITNMVMVALLSYAVFRRQLFNPLRELNLQLQREIAERRQAQDTLKESEERYRRLVESSFDGICISRGETILSINRAAADLVGAEDPEDLVGRSLFEFVHPQYKDFVAGRLEQLGQQSEIEPVSHDKFIRSDGQVLDVEVMSVPVSYRNQPAILAVFRDISERVKAEELLSREKLERETILDSVLDHVIYQDLDHRILWANQETAKSVNMRQDQLIGRFCYEIWGDRHDCCPDCPVDLAITTGQRHEIEKTSPNGRFWFIRGFPVRDVDGKIVAGIEITQDITAGKWVEQLLNALNRAAWAVEQVLRPEQIFAAVGEEFGKLGLQCVVFLMDPERSQLYPAYISHDPEAVTAAEQLTGLKVAEYSLPVEQVEAFRTAVQQKQALLIDGKGVLEQALPDGTKQLRDSLIKILDIPKTIVAPLVVEDRVAGLLSVQSENLTESDLPAITAFSRQMAAAWHKARLMVELQENVEALKRTQDQLVQAQKMEAIGRLAGGIAHDFNNMLSVINGYAELLLQDYGDREALRAGLQEIEKAASKAVSLTDQLLAFSRKKVLKPLILNLNTVVSDMQNMVKRLIGEHIELVTVLSPALGSVRVDLGQMQQVIMNLTVNARDAMPNGGRLTIETENVELDQEYAREHLDTVPGPYVMLTVCDNGEGMNKHTQEHLFEPFFTTKDRDKGTGLGMATVYGIVKQSGGAIHIYSEVGRGTVFKIYLPRVAQLEENGEPARTDQAEDRGSETILVVEDEEAVRKLERSVLRRSGYTVLEAPQAHRAIELAADYGQTIHLLLTDVVMPGGMSGLELAEILVRTRPRMPVLYTSGYTDNAIVHHGVLNGGVNFLQKPFTPGMLVRKVREVLDEANRRSQSP